MFMIAIAVLALVLAILGLWLPVSSLPGWWLLCIVSLAWWFAGLRGVALAGVFAAALVQSSVYHTSLPGIQFHNRDVLVSGCIDAFPRINARGTAFSFSVDEAPAGVPYRLYLTVFNHAPGMIAGSCHDLLVRLKRAHGQGNPGQFDRAVWLYREGIAATGYVRDSGLNRPRPDLKSPPLLVLRREIRARILAMFSDPAAAGLLGGLVVGDRTGISHEHWELLRQTGTTHLIAISGLHIALIAAGVAGLVMVVFGRGMAAPRLAGAVFGALAGLLYAVLAGWSVPTSRAALMVLFFVLVFFRGRHVAALQILALTLFTALLAGPVTVLGPGFWMSYCAVAVLLSASPNLQINQGIYYKSLFYLWTLVSAQWRLSVGLLVPNLWLFQAWAPAAPLINLLAIPVFTLLVLPAVLVASICSTVLPACGRVAMPWIEALLQRCLWALQSMRPGDGGAMLMAPGPLVFFVLTPSVLVLLAAFSRPWKLAAIAVILVTLMSPMVWGWRPAAESLQLDILDVGQGTAVVVRTRRHALLVDAGPAWPGGSAGAMTVLPFLQSAAIDHLDALLVSHDDNDHSGGVTDVLTAVPADLVLAPRQIAGANAVACRAGMNWEWDSVHFALLHPSSVAGWSDNDASCVLSIRYRGTHILLPGDIEAAAETVLIARAPTLHADVVVVPHHGSKTSSGAAFIAATRPRYAVYTTAFWNRWQFPAESVRRGWRSSGACQLNTATTGMLRFRWSDSVGLQLQTAYNHSWARPAAVRSSPAKVCTEH